MRCLILSLLLLGVGQSWAEESGAPSGGLFGGRLAGVVEPRLAVNAIRIHDLEKHIEKLKSRIEEAEKADPETFLNDLDYRLTQLEGTHCESNEFQCGDNGQECISDLFVCDGHKDCHNGHDEDKDVCDASAVKAGRTFSGTTHWKACFNWPDHTSHLTIVGTRRAHFFSSRIGVQAIITAEWKDKKGETQQKHFEMYGGYNFANRKLYLIPMHQYGQANLAYSCVFDHGDNERLDCTIQTEASENQCAETHLALQHHSFDDEHHEDDEDDKHDHHDDDDHDKHGHKAHRDETHH